MFPKPQCHEPPQFVHPFVAHKPPATSEPQVLPCPEAEKCVRTEINPNFSRDQLDRVDRERTNRDTIAKGEQ